MSNKESPKKHILLFRNVEYSLSEVVVKGAVGGSFLFPVPVFSPQCICCNANTDLTKSVDPSDYNNRQKVDPIDVPVCKSCQSHAISNIDSQVTALIAIIVGILLIFSGLGNGVIAGSILLVLVSAGWLFAQRLRRIKQTHSGHFPGFTISVDPGQISIETYNKELADRLVRDNEQIFYK